MKKNHLWRLLGATVTTALLSVLVPTAATAAEEDPMTGAPEAGTCYNISGKTAAQQMSLTQATVACTKKHTLWLAGVTELPEGTDLDFTEQETARLASDACVPHLRDLLGEFGTAASGLSAYRYYIFLPTKAQQRRGARWTSCVAGISRGGDKLVTTRRATPVKVRAKMPDYLTVCGTRMYEPTSCAARHAFRPSHAQVVRFRGEFDVAKRDRLARKVCGRYSEPGQRYMWMSRAFTEQRYVLVCLNADRR